ncbi:hypothetical protein C1X84_11245 [Pseudomonas sp. GP01-A1]|nr:hypothetical protein C1X90_00355 [Pseudomonas sp. GP01-A9]PMU30975.1 hypothetical protein C1X88_07785 [Pseudomonas sp. GP01-A13]PMU41590.1 hypothetical protein C1X87_32085 [Pseudomonas sp. GP01-A14]PMU58215.1 hypothetical protein C1X85_01165 [Pseudomonas sp. GP01-A6]PMU64739.1 hypothetical protein C1X86_02010 [Pseudomonas sp. GP01-A3]PMU76762.1 hypothetical protein C1X84_11245 [Pseudomonas sp. GP01-A1]PMU77607.1 hypothetical protein C1X81_06260 [Pseudomonas sp. FW215-L2]PMU85071.1 hypothe
MARELAPAGSRSGPQNGTAAQFNGSKLPRHKVVRQFSKTCQRPRFHRYPPTAIPITHRAAT